MQYLSEQSVLGNELGPHSVLFFRVRRVCDLERRTPGSFVKHLPASQHVTSERTCTNGKQKIGQLDTFGVKRTFTMFIMFIINEHNK